jgi:hypothetical protein
LIVFFGFVCCGGGGGGGGQKCELPLVYLPINMNSLSLLYALFWVITPAFEFYMPTFRNTLSVPSS